MERRADLDQQPSHAEPSTKKTQQQQSGPDLHRSSIASRRTCSSSPSSVFFPNASRSPRDLASLAARVHASTPDKIPLRISSVDPALAEAAEGDSSAILKGENWQLPSLRFRPLSFINCVQVTSDRPRSAEGTIHKATVEIVSPTPERPVSSQSRKQFSKILGLEDEQCSSILTIFRSYNSLNFGKLRRVAEVPESNYPNRLSIPPFSPRRSTIQEGKEESGPYNECTNQDERSSQAASNEQSTVELLLDMHIECLGLQPDEPEAVSKTKTERDDKSYDRSTNSTKIIIKPLEIPPTRECSAETRLKTLRLSTVSSTNQSTIASPERELLVPNKLSSNRVYSMARSGDSRLTSVHSLPCLSASTITDRTPGRPSTGWHTLISTTHLLSSPSVSNTFQPNEWSLAHKKPLATQKFKVRRCSGLSLSSSSASYESQTTENLYDWDAEAVPPRRLRNRIWAVQASKRRNQRVKLKVKRNSSSQGSLSVPKVSLPADTSQTPPALSQINHHNSQEEPCYHQRHVDIDSREVLKNDRLDLASDTETAAILCQNPKRLIDINHPWSSILAIDPEVDLQSANICRKISVRTVRSHGSNACLADPTDSTRPSIRIPQLNDQVEQINTQVHGSNSSDPPASDPNAPDLAAQGLTKPDAAAPNLAAPGLSPSLSALHLDMSVRYPNVFGNATRPVLRGTRSFFSDDSSAVVQQRGSFRKRLHLHSLRDMLPTSPRATAVCDSAATTPKSSTFKPQQSRVTRGTESHEQERDLYGTVGMSDFAYRKRRIVERLKDWWKRHSMQRKLGLNRKKSNKSVSIKSASRGLGHGLP